MGGFKSIFHRKNSSQDSHSNGAPPPTPLWAMATEPSPVTKRPASGPRPLSSSGYPSSRQPMPAPRHDRTHSRDQTQSTSRSIDELSSDLASMKPFPPDRRPLPSTPSNPRLAGVKLTKPSHARTLSEPDRPLPPPSPTRPSASRGVFGSPPKSNSSRSLAPPMSRGAASWSGHSTASYAPSAYSHASSSSAGSSTTHAAYSAPMLYPQAVPAPPRPPLPPTPIHRPSDNSIFRQAVVPASANTSPQSISTPEFPGAFPMASYESPTAERQMPQPKPYDGNSAWDGSDVSFMKPTYSQSSTAPLINHQTRPPLSNYNSASSTPPSRHHARPVAKIPAANAVRRQPKPKPPVIDLCSSDSESDSATQSAPPPPRTPTKAVKNQCHGTTASGKRCTRTVDSSSTSNSPATRKSRGQSPGLGSLGGAGALDDLDIMLQSSGLGDDEIGRSNAAEETAVPRLCFQHSKQSMQERGCFVNGKGKKGEWIEFDDWIMGDLPVVTKILLRHEMARPVSSKDEEGYIYAHEMVERRLPYLSPSPGPQTTYVKLGRSVRPVSRLSQWRSQCASREPIVRDIFPRASSTLYSGAGVSGALQVAPRGVQHHHRWERLMLIEVAGRAAQEAEVRAEAAGITGAKPEKKKECKDCGKVHIELFELNEGAYEEWVMEIVERWMRWCRDILG